MKFLEKVGLIVFSSVVLIASILVIVVLFGWINLDIFSNIVQKISQTNHLKWITIGILLSFILLAVRCIFFSSFNGQESKSEGVLLANESGKLLISRETLENIVNGVVKGFEGAKDASSRVILDGENNVIVYVTLFVMSDVVIKELSNNIQSRIKEAIKKSSDLDVKEVNVKIKNLVAKKVEEA